MLNLLNNTSVDLSNLQPIRQGEERNVYELSFAPSVVIKTIRPEILNKDGYFINNNAFKNMRQLGGYRTKYREITEYLIQSRKKYRHANYRLPIAHIFGIIQTSEGIGLVSEKITDEKGNIAPTLGCLKKTGKLTKMHFDALHQFKLEALQNHIVFSDIHPGNLAYTEIRTGVPEFVCIDGFGEKSIIPFHRWSKQINDRKIERIFKRLIDDLPAGNQAL